MKSSYLAVLLFVGSALAHPAGDAEENQCPPSKPTFGACVFDPKVNCLSDSECKSGEVCCSQGCNKVCKPVYNRPKPPNTPRPPLSSRGEDAPSGGQSERCPAAAPSFGACVFDPKVNCQSDMECRSGQYCCSDGCNKICKAPLDDKSTIDTPSRPGSCPATPVTFGACVFNPDRNCLDDSACPGTQKCCSDGCNKVCMPADDKSIGNPTRPGSCPATPVTFGACVFNPDRNCLDDSACPSTQKCCSDGCNKVCMPVDDKTDPSKIPITPINGGEYNKCPARAPGSPIIGTCVFDANVNCVSDTECRNGQACCPAGCNKVCVNPQPRPVHPATRP